MPKENPFPYPTLDPALKEYTLLDGFGMLDPAFTPHIAEIIELFDRGRLGVPIEVLRYTFGPLIVHCATHTGRVRTGGDIGWLEGDIIDKWRPRVIRERLDILLGKRPFERVSCAEIFLVMHNAMMDAPMTHHASTLYVWASHRALEQSGWGDQDQLDAHSIELNIPADDEVLQGGNAMMTMTYQDMAQEIRAKVIRHASDRFVRRKPTRTPDQAMPGPETEMEEADPPSPFPEPVLRPIVVEHLGL